LAKGSWQLAKAVGKRQLAVGKDSWQKAIGSWQRQLAKTVGKGQIAITSNQKRVTANQQAWFFSIIFYFFICRNTLKIEIPALILFISC